MLCSLSSHFESITSDNEFFRTFLNATISKAAEKGHVKCADFHSLSALATDYLQSGQAVGVVTRVITDLDKTVWSMIKTYAPISQPQTISHRLWYLVHSVCADAQALQLGAVSVAHVTMYFLTRPNVLWDIIQNRDIDRLRLLKETCDAAWPNSPVHPYRYYAALSDELGCLEAIHRKNAMRTLPSS